MFKVSTETKYNRMEKECLAIKWAVPSVPSVGTGLQPLFGPFPAQLVHCIKDANPRIIALRPFKFEVIHRPGAQVAVADFLSGPSRGGGGVGGGSVCVCVCVCDFCVYDFCGSLEKNHIWGVMFRGPHTFVHIVSIQKYFSDTFYHL